MARPLAIGLDGMPNEAQPGEQPVILTEVSSQLDVHAFPGCGKVEVPGRNLPPDRLSRRRKPERNLLYPAPQRHPHGGEPLDEGCIRSDHIGLEDVRARLGGTENDRKKPLQQPVVVTIARNCPDQFGLNAAQATTQTD